LERLISPRVRFTLIAAGVVLLALIGAGAYFRSQEMARQAASAAEADAATAAVQKAVTPAAPVVLVEAANENPAVTVQVLAARRVTPDTLRVELTLISRSAAPEALDLSALAGAPGVASSAASAAASSSGGVVPAKGLGIADLCLLTADGSRRLFALRDAEDKPVGGGDFAPLGPNEHRAIWALFPAPPVADTTVTLLVGALTLPNVPIS
jgi:hypothetical protein